MMWGRGSGQSVDVFTAPIIPSAELEGHPCPKPIKWGTESILRLPAGGILDPFCGSGTTLLAAKQLGRRCIGVEISEAYCAVTVQRLEAKERRGKVFAGGYDALAAKLNNGGES